MRHLLLLIRQLTLLLVLAICPPASHAASGTTYNLPADVSSLPGSCTYSSGTKTISCTGNLSFSGQDSLNITTSPLTLSVGGNLEADKSLDISSGSNAFTLTIGGNLQVKNTSTFNAATLTVGGNIDFKNGTTLVGNVSGGGNITIKNNFNLTGNITAGGTLDVGNNYTINGTCTASNYVPSGLTCAAGSLSIGSTASISEGNSGSSNLAFTVTLSKTSTSSVTVKYTTTNGTATGGSSCAVGVDYVTATNSTLTIAAGQTTGTINISICGDTTVEPDETFTVTLSSPSGASLGTTTSSTGTILNDDTSAPATFNGVDSGANGVTGKIGTKVVGATFNLDVVALNSGKTAVDTSINQQVLVDLLANTSATAVGSDNCPASGTAIPVTSPTLSAGKATVAIPAISSAYRDVRVRIRYPATGTATVIACSADNFAVRPGSLSLAVQDEHWAQAYTTGTPRTLNNIALSGGVVHKAGQPFTISSTARASDNTTQVSNYDGSATLVTSQCATTDVCPAAGSLGSFSSSSLAFSGGTVSNSSMSYSEVGSFTLQLQDTTFAAVDAGDGTSADCAGRYACSTATDVGRFVPNHYAITSTQTPKLQTFGSSCASRSFTYLGQPIGFATLPKVTITAQNASNGTTANYKNTVWKLAASHLGTSWSCQTGTGGACPTATTAAPTFGSTDLVSNGDGTGTFTWPTDTTYPTGLAYSLARTTATPLAAFTAQIGLGITIADTSESSCGTSPCTLIDNQGATKTWATVPFDSGTEFRHGRLKIGNAYGATNLDLAIPLEVQHYSAGSFVTNTADNCTTLAAGNIGLRNAQKKLGLTEIGGHVNLAGTSFASGQKKLRLAKPTPSASPNEGVDGTIDVFAYLGPDASCAVSGATVATPAPSAVSPAMSYLQDSWPWDGATCANPVGRATFGLERQKFLYMREQY